MTLIRHHAKTEALSTLIWAAVLGVMGFLTTYMWEMMRTSGSMADLEKTLANAQGVVKSLVGTSGVSLFTLDGWIQGYSLGGWNSLLYVIFTALFVAGMITREMDRRTIEFVLSLPVSRSQLLLSRYAVLAGSLALLHLSQWIGVVSGVASIGQDGSPGRYGVALLNSLLLQLFLGSLMLVASLFFDDYGPGTGAVLGIGLGLNLLHMGTGDATGALKSLRDALPFSWYDVTAIIIKGEVPWGDMLLLGGGALLFLGLAVWIFQRKQITV